MSYWLVLHVCTCLCRICLNHEQVVILKAQYMINSLIMFACKIFLAISFAWQNNHWIAMHFDIVKSHSLHISIWYSKSCITHKCNIRISWKFRNKLFSCISTELHVCQTNGPLNKKLYKIRVGIHDGRPTLFWAPNGWQSKMVDFS